jgi:hypothetical protein
MNWPDIVENDEEFRKSVEGNEKAKEYYNAFEEEVRKLSNRDFWSWEEVQKIKRDMINEERRKEATIKGYQKRWISIISDHYENRYNIDRFLSSEFSRNGLFQLIRAFKYKDEESGEYYIKGDLLSILKQTSRPEQVERPAEGTVVEKPEGKGEKVTKTVEHPSQDQHGIIYISPLLLEEMGIGTERLIGEPVRQEDVTQHAEQPAPTIVEPQVIAPQIVPFSSGVHPTIRETYYLKRHRHGWKDGWRFHDGMHVYRSTPIPTREGLVSSIEKYDMDNRLENRFIRRHSEPDRWDDFDVKSYYEGRAPRATHITIYSGEEDRPEYDGRCIVTVTKRNSHDLWSRAKDFFLGKKMNENITLPNGSEVCSSWRSKSNNIDSYRETFIRGLTYPQNLQPVVEQAQQPVLQARSDIGIGGEHPMYGTIGQEHPMYGTIGGQQRSGRQTVTREISVRPGMDDVYLRGGLELPTNKIEVPMEGYWFQDEKTGAIKPRYRPKGKLPDLVAHVVLDGTVRRNGG